MYIIGINSYHPDSSACIIKDGKLIFAVEEERLLEGLGERIRALVESTEGWLYLSTDSGNIFRLRPVDNNE